MTSKKLSVGDFSWFSISAAVFERAGLRLGGGERLLFVFSLLGDLTTSSCEGGVLGERGVHGERGEREKRDGERGELCDCGDFGDCDFLKAPVR